MTPFAPRSPGGNVFHKIHIKDCDTGISLPADGGNSVFHDLSIESTRIAVEFRDAPSTMQRLGLPSDTPPSELIRLIESIRDAHGRSGAERETMVRRSSLWEWISRADNVATVTTALVQIATSPAALPLLDALRSL